MIEIKAPNLIPDDQRLRIFLAGSIEEGLADNWQAKVVEAFKDLDVVVLNPRRDEWDATLEQSADNPTFAEQVNWEIDSIGRADVVMFYFDPKTKSPISLLELGYLLGEGSCTVIACCPEGFWRKGNVDIMLTRAGFPNFAWDEWILISRETAKEYIQRFYD